MVQDRLSRLSSSHTEFANAAPAYNDALHNAGYNGNITFTKPPAVPSNDQQHKRRRRRNVLWYNPPYSADVQSNVTKMFYAIIDKCFPEDHPYLGKLFNRKNMKLAYSTTRNVDAIIASHNKKILNSRRCRDVNPCTQRQGNNPIRLCNCRATAGVVNCPLKGMCLSDNIVYRCDVTTNNVDESRFYLGSCSTQWKARLHNHTKSFTHARYSNETTLSTYIWELKNSGKAFNLSWSIAAKAKSYHPLAGKCGLCTKEKTLIAANMDDNKCLNIRNELMAKCRHRRRWLLSSVPDDLGWSCTTRPLVVLSLFLLFI